jgi:GMP synthase (glutamine-hydrolysing)
MGKQEALPIREDGFMPVRQLDSHPLFANLSEQLVVFQEHYWEVKSMPSGFKLLARSELCGIQVMAHERLPLFGVQFHPEEYDDGHGDGRQLLTNFFQIVKERRNR